MIQRLATVDDIPKKLILFAGFIIRGHIWI